jgi:predicted ABC-type transport system involved in lysophospholipase L1 biosynthesis ATPase subunit
MGPDPLLRLRHVAKLFSSADGRSRVAVLDEIDLDIAAGEVVALLGRSGSGKSTLLRIMAGLLPPTEGVISRDGRALRGVNHDVAIVFQTFALLPWLTVEENTAIGLEARGLPGAEVRQRALKALAMVGLERLNAGLTLRGRYDAASGRLVMPARINASGGCMFTTSALPGQPTGPAPRITRMQSASMPSAGSLMR